MSTLKVINENGEIESVDVVGKEVTIVFDDGAQFEPAIVQRIEYDRESGISTMVKDIGSCDNKTSHRMESDKKPHIALEGVLTENELSKAKQIKNQRNPTIISDLYEGGFVLSRLVIEQNSNLVEFIPNGGEPQLAFGFQMQIIEQ